MNQKPKTESFYGMRLVDPYEKFIGMVWEQDGTLQLSLRFYYLNDNGKYVYEELENLPIDVVWNCKSTKEACMYLKSIAKNKKPSYNVFIEDSLYDGIDDLLKEKAKLQ